MEIGKVYDRAWPEDFAEREKLGLTLDQYHRFRTLFDKTLIGNLPEDLKKFYRAKTGFTINSYGVDLDWAREVFADYVREEKGTNDRQDY